MGVHAHVEWAIPHKAEAALWGIELVGGDAEIEEHPIDLADAKLIEERPDLGEVPLDGLKIAGV